MSNPSKQKGTAAETAVVDYARQNGFPQAQRIALAGSLDRGDVILEPGIIVEVKAVAVWSDLDVDKWIAETDRERLNMMSWWAEPIPWSAFLIVKRPRKGNVGDWWVFDVIYPAGVPIVGQFRAREWFDMLVDLRRAA